MKFFGSALALVVSVATGTAVNVYGAPPGAAAAVAASPASAATTAGAALHAAAWSAESLGGVQPGVFALALQATACALRSGDLDTLPQTLTVIDYSRPSTAERLWVFDLSTRALLYHELVAHGQGSGDNFATKFSNTDESHQSSVGLFVTEDTYVGKNGYSLRLRGLDEGFNDHAYDRAIVMHGAPYVSPEFAKQQGRLGRSWGCPALRPAVARQVIDRVKQGGAVFAYAAQPDWLRASKYLNCGAAAL
jgi:hypothetical protein